MAALLGLSLLATLLGLPEVDTPNLDVILTLHYFIWHWLTVAVSGAMTGIGVVDFLDKEDVMIVIICTNNSSAIASASSSITEVHIIFDIVYIAPFVNVPN